MRILSSPTIPPMDAIRWFPPRHSDPQIRLTSLVLQEVHGLMLAHYAVRRLIHEAARKVDKDPDRLSFVHAVRVVRRRVENPGVSPRGEK